MENVLEATSFAVLKLPFKALKLTGFDFLSASPKKSWKEIFVHHVKLIYFGFICANLLLCDVLQMVLLFTFPDDMSVLVNVFSSVVNMKVLLWKIFTIVRHRVDILDFLKELDAMKWNSVQPEVQAKVNRVLKLFNILKMAQFISLSSVSILFCLMPIVKLALTGMWYSNLPWDFWLPFDRFDKNYYNFVYLWIDWMFFNVICLFFAVDMIINAPIVLISIQFNFLNNDIRETIKNSTLHEVIEKHLNLIMLVRRFNDLFSLSFLLNFVGSSIVICFTAFLIASANDFYSCIKYGILLQLLLCQIFLLCSLGDFLKISSETTATSIYSSEWYRTLDRNSRVGVKLMLMQAQKPCQITAWKFSALNYGTFLWVLNATYSYFMLLRSKAY